MRSNHSLFAAFAAAVLFLNSGSMASPSDVSSENEKALVIYLWPLLKKDGGDAARVYYEANCSGNSMTFPRINFSPPSRGEVGVVAVKSIFRLVKNVSVNRDPDGIIHIRLGNFSNRILSTKISKVIFNGPARYNHDFALGAIGNAPEIRNTLAKLNIRGSTGAAINMMFIQPAPDLPHLPPVLTDLTLDQALDAVAHTFQGIILFGECKRPPFFSTTFLGGIYFDETTLTRDKRRSQR